MVKVLDENDLDEDYPGQPSDNGTSSDPNFDAIFNAPDYASFLKTRQTAVSREYTARTNSVLKALLISSLSAGDFADAAAIIHYGPQFAKATGGLADASDMARKAIDIFTSPSNPVALFALAAIPLVGQVFRNHEQQLAEVPATVRERRRERKAAKAAGIRPPQGAPRFTIKLGKRSIPIYFRMRIKGLSVLLSGFRSQTQEPASLASRVFSDPDVISSLEKQGIRLVSHGGE
jgi:hypothetical protein